MDPKFHWYVVHTYSGHENKVKAALKQRMHSLGLSEKFDEIVIPIKNVMTVRRGKKEEIKEKIFPGYILIKMIMDDETWLLVRTTPGVTSFVGAGIKPTPISEKEVEAIKKFVEGLFEPAVNRIKLEAIQKNLTEILEKRLDEI